jgi:hypothetical protein
MKKLKVWRKGSLRLPSIPVWEVQFIMSFVEFDLSTLGGK